jgi:hypothetical protein
MEEVTLLFAESHKLRISQSVVETKSEQATRANFRPIGPQRAMLNNDLRHTNKDHHEGTTAD